MCDAGARKGGHFELLLCLHFGKVSAEQVFLCPQELPRFLPPPPLTVWEGSTLFAFGGGPSPELPEAAPSHPGRRVSARSDERRTAMSIPIHLKNPPSHIMEGTLNCMENSNIRSVSTKAPYGFPPTKSALWDRTPMGDTVGLHLGYYRNPMLLMVEKVLRLAYLHAKNERTQISSCFLLGSLTVGPEEDGVTLTVDRFDPGRETTGSTGKIPTAVPPGDFIIPCMIKAAKVSSGAFPHRTTSENFSTSFKGLQNHLCSKDALDFSKLLNVGAEIVYSEHMDNLNFELHWAAVTVANTFESIPIRPVPVIPTALARNLSSNINIAQVQGKHKSGYLTMDQTRKLLLVLESDPKVFTLPLVGLWLSGVTHVHSPQVWASCLRYMFSSSLKERVVSETGSFLIVIYSLTHREPEFYECLLCSGNEELSFQLFNRSDALHLFKNAEVSYKQPIQFELTATSHNAEIDFLRVMSKDFSISSPLPNKLSTADHDSGVEDEDLSPRPTPNPHPASQQVSRIHPSVPELSIVFDGSFADSKTMQKLSSRIHGVTPLSQSTLPHRNTCGPGNVKCQNQPSDSEPIFVSHVKEPSVGRLTNPRNQETPGRSQFTTWKGVPTRKGSRSSSSSSSSSPSTPLSGVSPDTSVLQQKKQPQSCGPCIDTATPRRVPPPVRRSHCGRAVLSPQSIHANSQNSHRMADRQMPVSPGLCSSSGNGCNCYHLGGHVQCCPSNKWQGICNINSCSTPEIHSEVAADSAYSAVPQGLACPNMCCSPVCFKRSPIHLGHPGNMENCCAASNLMSPRRMISHAGSFGQSCTGQSACIQAPITAVVDNGLMGLSADAYRLLAEQDRQLKLLQAQIQRLLDAQALHSCSTSSNADSQHKVEFIAMETQTAPGLQMTKSVSIAVSTGASLFWNSPSTGQENPASHSKQNDADNSDLAISVNPEEDTSHTSIASSLKAVDICSFAESSQEVDDEPNQFTDPLSVSQHLPNEPDSSAFYEHSPSGEINQHLRTELREGDDSFPVGAYLIPQPVQTVTSIPADHILYQDLLGQVNNLLRASSANVSKSDDEATSPCSTNINQRSLQTNVKTHEGNDVLGATMKQLRNLGVNISMDASDTLKKDTNKVENASVLACINPEAVIPRLNYLSFTNVAMSGFCPSGADLSMEANAIALKYLNESQLSQLSQSRTSPNNLTEYSAFHSLLNSNTEKSLVGLSLISPSNMSFATKKYLKRYGLIQSNEDSDEENELTANCKDDEALNINSRPLPEGLSCRKESAEQASERLKASLEPHIHGSPSSHFLPKADTDSVKELKKVVSPKVVQQPFDPNSLRILKDLHHGPKRLPSKAQYTRHPEKENAREMQFFPEKETVREQQVYPENLLANSLELQHPDKPKSVGDFLDVSRLRKLPKLF